MIQDNVSVHKRDLVDEMVQEFVCIPELAADPHLQKRTKLQVDLTSSGYELRGEHTPTQLALMKRHRKQLTAALSELDEKLLHNIICVFENGNLTKADLSDANLAEADLSSARVWGANLSRIILLGCVAHPHSVVRFVQVADVAI